MGISEKKNMQKSLVEHLEKNQRVQLNESQEDYLKKYVRNSLINARKNFWRAFQRNTWRNSFLGKPWWNFWSLLWNSSEKFQKKCLDEIDEVFSEAFLQQPMAFFNVIPIWLPRETPIKASVKILKTNSKLITSEIPISEQIPEKHNSMEKYLKLFFQKIQEMFLGGNTWSKSLNNLWGLQYWK